MFSSKFVIAALASFALIGPIGAFYGRATAFEPGTGVCGQYNTANDYVAALSMPRFDNGESCLKDIRVTYGDKSITVSVVDVCFQCAENDIELSPAAFGALADESTGASIPVEWDFV